MNGSNAIFTANQLGTETVVVTVGEISACTVLEILVAGLNFQFINRTKKVAILALNPIVMINV